MKKILSGVLIGIMLFSSLNAATVFADEPKTSASIAVENDTEKSYISAAKDYVVDKAKAAVKEISENKLKCAIISGGVLLATVYLDNKSVRQWYNDCDSKISESINKNTTICEQAKQAFDMRNNCRVQARSKMHIRSLAWFLDWYEPNWTWKALFDKQSKKYNVSGDAACERILGSSQRTRASVNNLFGVSHQS